MDSSWKQKWVHHENKHETNMGVKIRCEHKTATKIQQTIVCNKEYITDLIGLHGDYGAESKYKGVNILHVQVVCGHCV